MMRMIARRLRRPGAAVAGLLLDAALARAQSSDEPSSGPVFPYILALLFTIIVLVIVCMPSRKS